MSVALGELSGEKDGAGDRSFHVSWAPTDVDSGSRGSSFTSPSRRRSFDTKVKHPCTLQAPFKRATISATHNVEPSTAPRVRTLALVLHEGMALG
eukprot:scaffold442_cov268-Pinguiococcus_pyrenoidosus.AAC.16